MSWASDVCAAELAPALRKGSGGARPVSFDDVMDALRLLDRQFGHYGPPRRYRQVLANRALVCSGAMLDVARTRPMARANRSIER